jgi:hypothetical protein
MAKRYESKTVKDRKAVPTFPDRPWYKRTNAILSLSGGAIALIASVAGLWKILFDPPSVMTNVEFVVDVSEGFGAPLAGLTKSTATAEAVSNGLTGVSSTDNIAVRTFGGACDSSGTQLISDFGRNNLNKVGAALQAAKFRGRRPLVRALIEATGDFNDYERFGNKIKKLILITGGLDNCPDTSASPDLDKIRISSRLASMKISMDVVVIGVGIPLSQRDELASIAAAAGGMALFADSKEQIEKSANLALRQSKIGYVPAPEVPPASANAPPPVTTPASKADPEAEPEPERSPEPSPATSNWKILSHPLPGQAGYKPQQVEYLAYVFIASFGIRSIERFSEFATPAFLHSADPSQQEWYRRVIANRMAIGELRSYRLLDIRLLPDSSHAFDYQVIFQTSYDYKGAIEILKFANDLNGPLVIQSAEWCDLNEMPQKKPDEIEMPDIDLTSKCFMPRFP